MPRMPRRTDVVVIGAGHSGLAMSRALGRRSIDHCVLERGTVAHAWRTARWDSLRLITPNWLCRLPGQDYAGESPDGYMEAGEVADFIARYAGGIAAPVYTATTVLRVAAAGEGFVVATDQVDWSCRAVVLANGACGRAAVPPLARDIDPRVAQWTAARYRRPEDLDPGGVLVVGAFATGVQLAQELRRSGRRVMLAVGEHVRMPRLYRGRDIQWWLLASGVLDQRVEEIDDPDRARRPPSPQLVGSPERATLDLATLKRESVELCGRLAAVRGDRALFSGGLRNVSALADLKMDRMLDGFDAWARRAGVDAEVGPPERYAPTPVARAPHLALALGSEVKSIVWATGFRPALEWLALPVFDRFGHLRHDRGVLEVAGLYVLGLPLLRKRKSSFIHGAADDVAELVLHLVGHLERCARRPVRC